MEDVPQLSVGRCKWSILRAAAKQKLIPVVSEGRDDGGQVSDQLPLPSCPGQGWVCVCVRWAKAAWSGRVAVTFFWAWSPEKEK